MNDSIASALSRVSHVSEALATAGRDAEIEAARVRMEQSGHPMLQPLGGPDDEGEVGDGRGWFRNYGGGTVFWSPETGARVLFGEAMGKWLGVKAQLGYPVEDEHIAPDGVGHYVHLERGSIYWSPSTKARAVYGAIRELWASMGWERSWLGYPVSDEVPDKDGRRSTFEHGYIRWTAAAGAAATKTVRFD